MTIPTIPAGMKPWAGGDSAPSDWDGGAVLLRDLQITDDGLYEDSWQRGFRGDADRQRDLDIIAYTPATPDPIPAGVSEAMQGEVLSVTDAARALVDKLDATHADFRYQFVWRVNQLHVGPYAGPTYTDEMAALRRALADRQPEQGEVERNTVTIAGRVYPLDSLAELHRLFKGHARIEAVHFAAAIAPASSKGEG